MAEHTIAFFNFCMGSSDANMALDMDGTCLEGLNLSSCQDFTPAHGSAGAPEQLALKQALMPLPLHRLRRGHGAGDTANIHARAACVAPWWAALAQALCLREVGAAVVGVGVSVGVSHSVRISTLC